MPLFHFTLTNVLWLQFQLTIYLLLKSVESVNLVVSLAKKKQFFLAIDCRGISDFLVVESRVRKEPETCRRLYNAVLVLLVLHGL